MKWIPTLALSLSIGILSGCGKKSSSNLIYEGSIYTLQWTDQSGNSHGMSRLSIPESAPLGTWSWNMDLRGRLYNTHLEITNRQSKDLGPQIIPFDRIDSVQFGDGGRVSEKPKLEKPEPRR